MYFRLMGFPSTTQGCFITIRESRSLTVQHCTFVNSSTSRNGGSIYMNTVREAHVKGCTFQGGVSCGKGGAVLMSTVSQAFVDDCTFANNTAGHGGAIHSSATNVTISNSKFRSNNAKTGAHLPSMGGAVEASSPRCREISNLVIFNSSFTSNRASKGGGVRVGEGINIHVRSSTFEGNQAVSGGALCVESYPRKKIDTNIFKNNSAYFGGAIYYALPKVFETCAYVSMHQILYVKGCTFMDNIAKQFGQSVYYTSGAIFMDDNMLEVVELMQTYHIYANGANEFVANNITFHVSRTSESREPTSRVMYHSVNQIRMNRRNHKGKRLQLHCPIGFNVDFVNSSSVGTGGMGYVTYTLMTLKCKSCPYDSYGLQRGHLVLDSLAAQIYKQHPAKVTKHACLKCPSGGICNINVKSVDNYWGYKRTPSELSFYLCPNQYCCSREGRKCTAYNTCAHGRDGTLCGSCAAGFKQSFVTTDCIPQGAECKTDLFLLYIVLYSFAYTLLFVVVTNIADIVAGVKNMFTHPAPKSNQQYDDKNEDECDVILVTTNATEQNRDAIDLSMAGFVQIVILFYQVASLLKVKFQDRIAKEEATSDATRELISKLFNFRLTINQGLCPSDHLTLPGKEMILFGVKLATFFNLLVILLTFKMCGGLAAAFVCKFRNKEVNDHELAPKQELCGDGSSVDMKTSPKLHENLRFSHRLKLTFIKLLKLYYTPIAKASLQMIHCVKIRDNWHLFVHAKNVS